MTDDRQELVTDFVVFVLCALFLAFAGWAVTVAKDHHDTPEETQMCITPSMQEVECP